MAEQLASKRVQDDWVSALGGDRRHFEEMVNELRPKIKRFVWRLTGKYPDLCGHVEEILQITFLKAWAKGETYDGTAAVLTWLCTIARNEAMNVLRGNERRGEMNSSEAVETALKLAADPHAEDPNSLAYEPTMAKTDALKAKLEKLVAEHLTEKERKAVNVHFDSAYAELSTQERAVICGQTRSAYNKMVSNSLTKLRSARQADEEESR